MTELLLRIHNLSNNESSRWPKPLFIENESSRFNRLFAIVNKPIKHILMKRKL